MGWATKNQGAATVLLLDREARLAYKAVCGNEHHFTGVSQAFHST